MKASSCIKMYQFWLKFHRNMFLCVTWMMSLLVQVQFITWINVDQFLMSYGGRYVICFPHFWMYICVCECKYMCEWKQNFKHCNACYNESNRMCRECSPKLFLVCKLQNFRFGRYTFIGIWRYWYTEASNRLFYDDYTVHRGSYTYHPR